MTTANPLDRLRNSAEHLGQVAVAVQAGAAGYHETAVAVHSLCSQILAAEGAIPDEAIRSCLHSARALHAQSPFIARLQAWPRGYAGDFETIEYLIGQRVQASPGMIGYWLEYLALASPVAQQHRNKVHAQAREVTSAVLASGCRPRVLVLAAGSSPDVMLAWTAIRDRDFFAVLHDGDEAALEFSIGRLEEVRGRVQAVAGNVLTSLGRLAEHGPFDLVVAGGLFDYLPDRHAVFLIRAVWERLLAPGGRLFFTNIGRGNPYRVWIEYLAEWRLIERSEAELRQMVSSACGPAAVCSVVAEGTGLAWLVSVVRSGHQWRATPGTFGNPK